MAHIRGPLRFVWIEPPKRPKIMNLNKNLGIILPIALWIAILSATSLPAATFLVTNAKDSGAGSLRGAIARANTNGEDDTINFDPTFFSVARTITLTGGEILISADDQSNNGQTGRLVTINGPGSQLLTISGNNASRIFLLAGNPGAQLQNANVTMNGMTLRDGNGTSSIESGNGGAIYAFLAANLTLNSMVLRNNVVTAVANAGAIFSNGSRNVVINNCLITENSAYGGGGMVIGNENQTFTMRNTIVSNNTASSADVGGISISRGTIVIANCEITGNVAARSIGGMDVYQARMDITDTVISGNEGTTGGPGGLSFENTSVVNLRRVTISDNSTTSGGGGMSFRNIGEAVNIVDSTISNNTVTGNSGSSNADGGGVFIGGESNSPTRITNTTISGNTAGIRGGGIYNFSHGLEVINSTVVNNVVLASAGGTSPSGGGGIYDGELGRSGAFGFRFKLQNSIIAGNTAATGPDIFSGFDSAGYNIIGNTANTNNSVSNTGDQFNVNPQVGALANNGGPTLTHALLTGSPAIDKGKSADVLTDQRGLARPYNNPAVPSASGGDGSDIGAFEDQPPNSETGSNVTVMGPGGEITVTFHSVSAAGFTTFSALEPPSSAGTPPEGYEILETEPAYDVATTATYTAPITVALIVAAETSEADFARIRILHGENGALVDRTILPPDDPAPNFRTKTVYAQVNSLSPFVVALAPNPTSTFPLNIATRMEVKSGNQVLIGGFIVTGTQSKKVLLRAIGPSLAGASINGALANPVLELHAQNGNLIRSNDNWMTNQKAAIEATGVAPTNKLESAIVATLDPGSYTAIVKGKGNGTGIGLVEIYDLDQTVDSQLANISTRGFVDTGDNVLIGGFILGGGVGNTHIYVRALGPSLGQAGLSGALASPTLELRNANGTLVRQNDNWKEGGQRTVIEATGIPPTKPKESALVETLAPGNYTAIVAGQNKGTGVGLVEVYRLP